MGSHNVTFHPTQANTTVIHARHPTEWTVVEFTFRYKPDEMPDNTKVNPNISD